MNKNTLNKIMEIINQSAPSCGYLSEDVLNEPLQILGLNSLTFLSSIVAIEDEFQIRFPEDKLTMADLGTIQALYDTVVNLIKEQDE